MLDAVSRIVMPKLYKRVDVRKNKTPGSIAHIQTYLNTSAAFPYVPCSTSGAKYSLSPSRSKVPSTSVDAVRGRGQREAIPKSPILNRPSPVTNMFAGFRSR